MVDFQQISINEVRQFWDSRPCNIRHSTRAVGTREYFDEVEARKYFVERHIPPFAEFARWRGKEVLEIGCGIGTDTINFARHGANVTVLELSPKSLELARRRAEVFGLADKIVFYNGNAEEMTSFLPPKRYDLIYSFGVIHHSPSPEKIIEQLHHFIKPGGTVKIMVYHRNSWKVFWILITYGKGRFWRANELIAKNSEAQTGCPVTYTYTRRDAKRLLARGGFTASKIDVDHIFQYRISDYIKYRYVKTWYFRWMPGGILRRLEKIGGWHLCVTAGA